MLKTRLLSAELLATNAKTAAKSQLAAVKTLACRQPLRGPRPAAGGLRRRLPERSRRGRAQPFPRTPWPVPLLGGPFGPRITHPHARSPLARAAFACAAIALAALGIAIVWTSLNRGPWYDEFYTQLVTRPDRGIVASVRESWLYDNHPPLFYLLSWLTGWLGPVEQHRLLNLGILLAATAAGWTIVRKVPPLQVPAMAGKKELERLALASDVAEKWLEGAAPRRVIVVPGKLVNLVP